MKTKIITASLLLVLLGTPFTEVCAQGSLAPPGAPAPNMKTLDQLEPRTPISGATSITQSGSYYLTADIVVNGGNGIGIYADEVTLDLKGFTIRSTAPSATGYGIFMSGPRRDIAIANGFITGGVIKNGSGVFSGSGFSYGIYGSSTQNVKVSGISVAGCLYHGIYLAGDTNIVEGCNVRTVGNTGIVARAVKFSVVEDCGGNAISGTLVSDCRAICFGSYGIVADTVHNSYGYTYRTSGNAYGISAKTVQNSYGYGYSDTGLANGISATTVQNSYGYGGSNGGSSSRGISATTVQNSYGFASGTGTAAGYGIDASSIGNSVGSSNRDNLSSRGIIADSSVETCQAYCSYGTALEAESASNCHGESNSGWGIGVAKNAINCIGISGSSFGIVTSSAKNSYGQGIGGITATTVSGCKGIGTSSSGISATTVQNSHGESSSYSGISATTVQNSYGISSSSYGIYSSVAQNCYGKSTSGSYGLYTTIAQNCYGYNLGSGTGIYGYILNSCTGASAGTPVSYYYKYNMP